MRTLTRTKAKTQTLTIPRGFAWLKHLNVDDQAQFISGLLGLVLTALQTSDWSEVADWIEDWKATANVHADQHVARSVREARTELAHDEAVDWEHLCKQLGL